MSKSLLMQTLFSSKDIRRIDYKHLCQRKLWFLRIVQKYNL